MFYIWNRHYVAGVTGSFHGDMAHAYRKMLADDECGVRERQKMLQAARVHAHMEAVEGVTGRRWFTELLSEIK